MYRRKKYEHDPLWTHDFTIITIGSIVSMLGNAMSSFAMSLMVLDISESTLLYSLYITIYMLPQVVIPVFSGAVLDRFSRKKTIYTLDFISAGLYCLMSIIIAMEWFSFGIFLVYCFILGTIQSIYIVAYQSFYPLLVTEKNYQKAYSVASVVETLAAVMVPISAFLYNQIGLMPLLAANSICFFLAAVIETRVHTNERYLESKNYVTNKSLYSIKEVFIDIKEGLAYLLSEKGLLAIVVYSAFYAFGTGVSNVITLPFFKYTFNDGEYIYMLVWGIAMIGRTIGGGVHYRIQIPRKHRYWISLVAHIAASFFEAIYLFTSIQVMMIICFLIGFTSVSGYTMRVSSTQSYVRDEMKGRYNGVFNIINTFGSLIGGMIAGLLTLIWPERIVLLLAMLICMLAAIAIIGGQYTYVAKVYNKTS